MQFDDGLMGTNRPPAVAPRIEVPDGPHNLDIFFAAIETTRMPMLLTDPHRRDNPVVFANQAFLRMTGYALEEVMGRNCRFLQGPDTDRGTVQEIRDAISRGEQVTVEILNYRRDGASFWNALFISPVLDTDGRLAYFFASQLDVSRRRDAEAALRHAQRMEAVGQLTGGIAHDFNNLLQVMMNALELLKRDTDVVTPRSLHMIATMHQATTRARTLTQQLLAFSRKQKLEGRVLSVNALLRETEQLLRRSVSEQVEIEYALGDDGLLARLDRAQAQMAIMNIVMNARDAMPDGGKVVIRTESIEVDLEDEKTFEGLLAGRYVVIAISDNGTGIPASILPRVMEPFFTTKEEGKGTGLGLSMVYGFAKQSGGTARIYSEAGHGTTVKLYFPESRDNVARDEQPGHDTVLERGGSEHILVVDDRSDVAEMARLMLQDAGYRVAVASNGHEALRLLSADRTIRLVFSDVIMPGGMNGVRLARLVQRTNPSVKILLTTGYADGVLDHTTDDDFPMIGKPYTRLELIRKVRRVLDGATGVS